MDDRINLYELYEKISLFSITFMLGLRFLLGCICLYSAASSISYIEAYTNGLLTEADVEANPESSKIILDAIANEVPIMDMRVMNALQMAKPTISITLGSSLLTESCNNLNCDFFYYYFTCHDFGIHLDKTCARYTVGRHY